MKNKQYFQILILLIIIFLLILGTILFTMHLIDQHHYIYQWPTVLFIFDIYLISILLLSILLLIVHGILKVPKQKSSIYQSKKVKQITLFICLISLTILPKFYTMADTSDAPGILLIGLCFALLPSVAFISLKAVAAEVPQKLK